MERSLVPCGTSGWNPVESVAWYVRRKRYLGKGATKRKVLEVCPNRDLILAFLEAWISSTIVRRSKKSTWAVHSFVSGSSILSTMMVISASLSLSSIACLHRT